MIMVKTITISTAPCVESVEAIATLSVNDQDESAVLVSADDDEKLVVTWQESTKGDTFVAERMRKDNVRPP